jgi:D-3-phosphoglycerate dehydrogenase
MKNKIFVALSTFGEYGDEPLHTLRESGFPYVLNTLGRRLMRDEIIQMGYGCEGIIAGVEPYDDLVLEQMSDLRCISRCGAGIDNISLEKARERGVVVLNTPDVVVQPVVELTVAMIFDLLKKLSYHTALMRERRWEKSAGNLLAGKKVGILGLGKIGKAVAETMIKLGCKVYGADIRPDMSWAQAKGVYVVDFEDLLQLSDILTLHMSASKNATPVIGQSEIRKMKAGALLINTARGQFVDEAALYSALKDGHLAGAALDVFPEEPYKGILCDLDNIVLTPHIATLTKESRFQMELEATLNIINFFRSSSFVSS